MPLSRYAYTDESGNTGLNLFDKNQPIFWTGTLVAYADVDSKYCSLHRELLALAGVTELHGAQLGFKGIGKIAGRVLHICREKKLHFLFGRVDKSFIAATKMFDLAFDSGTNKAMPTHAYAVKQLRLINTMHFIQLLEEEDLIEFWDLFQRRDSVRFGRLIGKIALKVPSSPYDARSKQILAEVLEWGAKNPAEVLDPFSESDSPNFIAFTGLFGHLHELHEKHGGLIACSVHDEQNQFMKSFRRSYKLVSKWKHEDGPLTLISDIKALGSFDGELEVKSSHESFGLQLVDVCLWLLKRVLDKGDEPTPECAELVDWLLRNSYLVRFDFGQLARTVAEGAKFVEGLPLTDEQLAKGRRLLTEIEDARNKRLSVG